MRQALRSDTDFRNTVIESYKVDGMAVPNSGVGSLIRFDGPDEGLLHRAGKTISAAVYLENAAVNYAKEPNPSMILKSNGTNLTAERVSSLLSAVRFVPLDFKIIEGAGSLA